MPDFKLVSKFKPQGDQPQAIKKLIRGLKENKVEIYCNGNDIHLISPYSKSLEGDLIVYNLFGQKIFEKNISEIKTCNFILDAHGILIITFFDESSKKLYKEKVLLK